MKESLEDWIHGKTSYDHRLEYLILLNDSVSQIELQVQHNPHKTLATLVGGAEINKII